MVCVIFLITGEMRHLALFRDIHYFEINYIYQNLIVFTFLIIVMSNVNLLTKGSSSDL